MAKQPEKSKPKNHEKHEDKPSAQAAPPRQHTQAVAGTATGQAQQPQQPQPPQRQPGPQPLPRPVFVRRGDQQVPVEAQRVINALQQTVRSQAVLIRNYQELLKLDGRPVEDEDGEDEEGEAA